MTERREAPGGLFPHLVQFARPLSIDEALSLLELGARPFDFLDNQTSIYLLESHVAAVVGAFPFVRWVGAWRPEYKHPPSLPALLGEGTTSVYVRPLGPPEPEYLGDLTALGFNASLIGTAGLYHVPGVDKTSIARSSELWWVRSITPVPVETPLGTINFDAMDSRSFLLSQRLFDLDYRGQGVTVGVRDDGVQSNHRDLSGKFHASSQLSQVRDHGTHVTGIVVGAGIESAGGIRGVAPSSNVLFRRNCDFISWGFCIFPGGVAADLDLFETTGVRISNHSYCFGSGPCSTNYSGASAFDQYADDYGHLLVVAAGNDGPSTLTVGDPAVGKNVLAVGAISYTLDGASGFGRATDYSSRGPTSGSYRRLKPDIVAPGGDETADFSDPFYMYGVVAPNGGAGDIPTDNVWPEYSPDYIRAYGTSMAAPHVTGAVALLRQWSPPSSSSPEALKAQIIAHAIPLKGNSSTPLNGYANTTYGYGLVNPYGIMKKIDSEWRTVLFGAGTLTGSDREDVWSVTVPSGARKLVVALAYNDTEGSSGDLADDVDFKVESPSGTKYCSDADGNSGWTDCTRSPWPSGVNTESPVEKLVVENPSSGSWAVRVRFTAWPWWCVWPCVPTQVYGIVGLVILQEPVIALEMAEPSFQVPTGTPLNVPVTVRNTGGYIVPAVGVSVDGTEVKKFAGNLVGRNDSKPLTLTLPAHAVPGLYSYRVRVLGVNRGLSDATGATGRPPSGSAARPPRAPSSSRAPSATPTAARPSSSRSRSAPSAPRSATP
ncbi:MAG: S8 family serine peptidase [Candidatus Rokubacteria bacterium]|nr:S8 family serine peptidase [Candidatus Rokubacteria bacterium]MBI3106356.1 S8 family serine peptidase [Candidatus Rokubacteria bacterium]